MRCLVLFVSWAEVSKEVGRNRGEVLSLVNKGEELFLTLLCGILYLHTAIMRFCQKIRMLLLRERGEKCLSAITSLHLMN